MQDLASGHLEPALSTLDELPGESVFARGHLGFSKEGTLIWAKYLPILFWGFLIIFVVQYTRKPYSNW